MANQFIFSFLIAVSLFAQEPRLHVFAKSGKYGFISDNGTVRIPPQFDRAGRFREGLAPAARIAGTEPDPSGGKDCLIEALRWGYVDTEGRSAIPFTYRSAQSFSEGRAAVRTDNKWGYIDRTGRVVIQPKFESAGEFHESLAAVQMAEDGRFGYVDSSGRIQVSPQFQSASDFEGGVVRVSLTGGGSAIINKIGQIVARKNYVRRVGSGLFAWSGASYGQPYGLMGADGADITPAVFDEIGEFSDSVASARRDKRLILIDAKGNTLQDLSGRFLSVGNMREGLAPACVDAGGERRCGYIDSKAQFVITPRFQYADDFRDGTAKASDAVLGRELVISGNGKVLYRPKEGDSPYLKQSGRCDVPAPRPAPPPEDYSIPVVISTTPAGASVHLVPLWDWQTHEDGKLLVQDSNALSAYLVPHGVTPLANLKLKAQVYIGVFQLADKRRVAKLIVTKESNRFTVTF